MKKWTHETVIEAPIEEIWKLFSFSTKKRKKIMPNLVSVEAIEESEEVVGSVYRQIHRHGRMPQEYLLTVTDFKDTADFKRLETRFDIPRMLEVTDRYEIEKIDETTSKLKAETINVPLRWDMKFLLFFKGKKPVVDLCREVRLVAESSYGYQFNELSNR